MELIELAAYLDDYLAVKDFPDYEGAWNGLQVTGKSAVSRIALAVDACLATVEMAVQAKCDVMIVHHGLFWGGTAPVTGRYYARLSALIQNEIGLYACHLPLDAHREVGNNHVLARQLGLEIVGDFGEYENAPIGVRAVSVMSRRELGVRIRETLGVEPHVIATGPSDVRQVGVVSGSGASMIGLAASAGIDTLVTGEGAHHTYFDAEECGINLVLAGHYATETVGVKALGEHLSGRFGVEVEFLHHPTGL